MVPVAPLRPSDKYVTCSGCLPANRSLSQANIQKHVGNRQNRNCASPASPFALAQKTAPSSFPPPPNEKKMFEFVEILRDRVSHNLVDPMQDMSLKKWLRLLVIVCGYLLIRRRLVKWGEKNAIMSYGEAEANKH